VTSNYAAFWLRFDGDIPAREHELFASMLGYLVILRALTFAPLNLYSGLWRYTGIYELRDVTLGVTASTVAFYLVVHALLGLEDYPRSVFIVDSLLLIFMMGGLRLVGRLDRERRRSRGQRAVLIYGAGDAGEMVVRDMSTRLNYRPVGFIDDDPAKVGQRIHGVPVLGGRERLEKVIAHEHPDEVLVAIPRAEPSAIRAIVRSLEPYKLPIKTLPNLRDIIDGHVDMSLVRNLSIEDLLARAPVGLDVERVKQLIQGKRVMVTGAGGSIGSQLCRQIVDACPAALVLYERYENSMYAVANELAGAGAKLHNVIGDVTDVRRLNGVVRDFKPNIIFHAAAHKHVPLMELNVCEAVKNNVRGTRRVAEAAAHYGVERCVLISSDKAVDPSSVMGATKRVAELIFQDMASRKTSTLFMTVRFGNVLGSNGSVLPRFLDQIKSGGPVTVTHTEMRRYFMLIPEAVQLVLHAAALGDNGALYVLDMGEQINLLDMARSLIRLSGFVPDEEIPISLTGLRPGEKLSEALVSADEIIEQSTVDKVLRVRGRSTAATPLRRDVLRELEQRAIQGNSQAVLQSLAAIVPSFKSAAERWQGGALTPAELVVEHRVPA
jgi:FlaA1/EpsC-like NDP-sugar epimerase